MESLADDFSAHTADLRELRETRAHLPSDINNDDADLARLDRRINHYKDYLAALQQAIAQREPVSVRVLVESFVIRDTSGMLSESQLTIALRTLWPDTWSPGQSFVLPILWIRAIIGQ